MTGESDFLERLRVTFRGEAQEHRQTILEGLIALERSEGEVDHAVVETVYRAIHSLKGAARAVGLTAIERLCQEVETIFSGLKKDGKRIGKETFGDLYRIMDLVGDLAKESRPDDDGSLEVSSVGPKGEASTFQSPGMPSSRPSAQTTGIPATVRISAERMNDIFLRAEEMLSMKHLMAGYVAEFANLSESQCATAKSVRRLAPAMRASRIECRKGLSIAHAADRLDLESEKASALARKIAVMAESSRRDAVRVAENVDSLLSGIKTALMLPFSVLLESFARMIRDLATEEGKEVDWVIRDDDMYVDRRVLEKIKDPLIHLARNCVSHGIEKPADREIAGKARVGIVSLTIERLDGEKVRLTMSDDGAGVDIERVKAVAVAQGFVDESAASSMADRDALELIFLSSVSTSVLVSAISGRGLGMAIARESIEEAGGFLSVESVRGKGTVFSIVLPLSMAAFRGVCVSARGRAFVIPTTNVDCVMKLKPAAIVRMGLCESVPFDGESVPLASLADTLGIKRSRQSSSGAEGGYAVVMRSSGSRIAFRVDEITGERELLARSLGTQLKRVRNVGGATVLDSGDVVPILNPADLVKTVASMPFTAESGVSVPEAAKREEKILVVDDSVTSRTLLKNILEGAGYRVKTALDGAEAFALLNVESFGLLVSDVEMPKMDGFELCAKVRGSEKLADIPIILVTSLGTGEDKTRGMEAGADAFIPKSGFVQDQLLDTVRRFL